MQKQIQQRCKLTTTRYTATHRLFVSRIADPIFSYFKTKTRECRHVFTRVCCCVLWARLRQQCASQHFIGSAPVYMIVCRNFHQHVLGSGFAHYRIQSLHSLVCRWYSNQVEPFLPLAVLSHSRRMMQNFRLQLRPSRMFF